MADQKDIKSKQTDFLDWPEIHRLESIRIDRDVKFFNGIIITLLVSLLAVTATEFYFYFYFTTHNLINFKMIYCAVLPLGITSALIFFTVQKSKRTRIGYKRLREIEKNYDLARVTQSTQTSKYVTKQAEFQFQ